MASHRSEPRLAVRTVGTLTGQGDLPHSKCTVQPAPWLWWWWVVVVVVWWWWWWWWRVCFLARSFALGQPVSWDIQDATLRSSLGTHACRIWWPVGRVFGKDLGALVRAEAAVAVGSHVGSGRGCIAAVGRTWWWWCVCAHRRAHSVPLVRSSSGSVFVVRSASVCKVVVLTRRPA